MRCFTSPSEEESVQGVDGTHRLLSNHVASSGDWKELSPTNCPITIQLSTAGLPLSLLTSSSSSGSSPSATQSPSELPQKKLQPLYANEDAVDQATELLLQRNLVEPIRAARGAGGLPSGTPEPKNAPGSESSVSLKLGDLRGQDNVPNYLYLKNHQPNGRLLISYHP
ncbi:unnamed protein product [Dibothriocephalus latus]|uniref:Uncharacterized protein n=1 Tax=Dibothriocephalus latus TaxID=60516 RepID=A0A3P7LT35_DIBLA|nr:unnamed protein product [Dibothriocephalus latus]